MADQPQSPVGKLIVQESEQARRERISAEERKSHAARTMEALKQRFGLE
jgi:hypothetical protein